MLDNRQAEEHEVSVGVAVVMDVVHEPNEAGVDGVEELVGVSEDALGGEHAGEVVGEGEDGPAGVANTWQSLVVVGTMLVVELVAQGRMLTEGVQGEVAFVGGDESNNEGIVYMDFGSLDGVVDYDLDDIVLGEVGVVADDVAVGEASTLEVQFVVDEVVVAVVGPRHKVIVGAGDEVEFVVDDEGNNENNSEDNSVVPVEVLEVVVVDGAPAEALEVVVAAAADEVPVVEPEVVEADVVQVEVPEVVAVEDLERSDPSRSI